MRIGQDPWPAPGVPAPCASASQSHAGRGPLMAALVLGLLLALPAPAWPQGTVAQEDSTIAQARRAGRAAAERVPSFRYFVLGAVSGGTVGFFGLIAGGEGFGLDDPETQLAGLGAAGLVLTFVAAGSRRFVRQPADSLFDGRPANWQSAFREAYYQRAVARRQRAALLGALAGPVIGLGFLVLVAVSVSS